MIPQLHSLERAMLGPTNTGKTHFAVERLCAHSSGMMGFPLRLLAREVYDRVVVAKGPANVGLVTGEERIMPSNARWLLCTVESMPLDRDVAFVALDEAQLGIDRERGHVFTDRLLHARGREETLILGSSGLAPLVRTLLPNAELMSRPRFSQLTYAGPKKLSRLPPRTVIIAFSADEVYALAEQVRRHFGGTAIVMGSLSPRTRNAQVAMYQAGEVDYIVATDAVGMGLNLDVNHIAFSGLAKYDGTKRRRLTVSEMAQIAGRAGRHQRDGTFGVVLTAGDHPEFSQEEIDRIEEHRFPPLNWLYWRNSDLDFESPEALLSTLEAPPPSPLLRLSPQADDHAVLRSLLSDPDVIRLAQCKANTGRLWEACGLPDFRGTGPEFHARLVSRFYQHLAVGDGTIPASMIADDVARLDNVQGNIPTLASRLASVRTWTYVANRADWLNSPAQWAERTRAVDDKLSDALHRQLTERFVDRRTTRLARDQQRIKLPGDFAVDADGVVTLLDEPVGVLRGFQFQADPKARNDERKRLLADAETRLPQELARRALEVSHAPDSAFHLQLEFGATPCIKWRR
jgi:ATP-dependent RNA helicase SUPV3L1/SUV3